MKRASGFVVRSSISRTGAGTTSAGTSSQTDVAIVRTKTAPPRDDVSAGAASCARTRPSADGHSAGSRNRVDGLKCCSTASPGPGGRKYTAAIMRGNRAVSCQRS